MASGGLYRPEYGLALGRVKQALQDHVPGALRTQLKHVSKDRVLASVFVVGGGGFAWMAATEMLRLLKLKKNRKKVSPQGESSASEDTKQKKQQKKKRSEGKVRAGSAAFRRQLLMLLRIAVPSITSKSAALLLVQFFLLMMRTLLSVRATKASVHFLTKAISRASWRHWVNWVVTFALWMCAGIVVNSGLRYTERQIALEFRLALTRHAHAKYLDCNNFYRAVVLRQGGLDNLDHRITADIDAFSTNAVFLYGHSFKPFLEFVLSLYESSKDLGLKRPVVLFGYSIAMNLLLRGLAPSRGPMIVREQALEGDFRRAHGRLIAHAEEVAFLNGGATERDILDTRLEALKDVQSWHNLQTIRKSIVDNILKFQGLLTGGVFVHIPFLLRSDLQQADRISAFRGTEELMLRCGNSFTEILLLGKNVNELAGYTHRIAELFTSLTKGQVAAEAARASRPKETPQEAGQECIRFNQVTVQAPETSGKGRLLVKNLDLRVNRGGNVLVTGPNGCGKTSMFRVLAGLWEPLTGQASCPAQGLMWVPQNSYLVLGTLRDQVAYPNRLGFNTSQDAKITDCLKIAGLSRLQEEHGLNHVPEEWNDVLSGGERQRLGFARLFFHRPMFAVLDEATSAINPKGEQRLYREVVASGVTVFSIAHRMALRRFHQFELQIQGDGSGDYKLVDLPDEPASEEAEH